MKTKQIVTALALAAALLASASTVRAAGEICVVADPSTTPLNLRTAPNFKIIGTVPNGKQVQILQIVKGSDRREWAFIAELGHGGGLGWVWRRYLACP